MNIDTEIEVSNIKKLFFSLLIKSKSINILSDEDNNKSEYKSKICLQHNFTINEIKISNIIKNIPYYQSRYNILYSYKSVDIGNYNGKIFDKLELNEESFKNKLLLFQYKNNNHVKFNEYLFQLKTPKSLIYFVTESYYFLLNSLIELHNNNICIIDFSHKNIVLSRISREKPLLTSFNKSLHYEDLNISNISKIIESIDDYTYKPLELHVLFYLITNNLNTLSYSIIEEICNFYIDKLTVLKLYSQKYQKDFKVSCINFLKSYINKPRTQIVEDILKYHNTWCIYSLSLLYLHIAGNILRVYSCKNTFIEGLVLFLSKNINPEPLKREDITKSIKKYNDLYEKYTDWCFVNSLSVEKMKLLVILLED